MGKMPIEKTKDLKIKKTENVPVYTIEYEDLDSFMSYHLGIEYRFLDHPLRKNDSCYVFNIPRYDMTDQAVVKMEEQIMRFATGDYPYLPIEDEMLTMLYKKGIIPAGKYIIEVSW